jgi:hypothetical protein
MNLLRFYVLLLPTASLALGQPAQQTLPGGAANSPEALVRNLYGQVLAHHPIGVPEGGELNIFAPYLSKALLRKFDSAVACINDWYGQNPEPHLKPEVGWLELGPFSGENERASPQTFHVEKTESKKDGTFRVYLRLTWSEKDEKPENWRVATVVVRESEHFAVDDAIYLKDPVLKVEGRLSNALAAGCHGSHWVGFGDQQSNPK